jgi:hypothetical protein
MRGAVENARVDICSFSSVVWLLPCTRQFSLFCQSWFAKLSELLVGWVCLPFRICIACSRVCRILHDKSCISPTMSGKKRVHIQQFGIIHLSNPDLTYIRNLERNKIIFMSFHLLKTCIRNHSLFFYFFLHPPTYRETPMATTIGARIYARGEVSFAKLDCQTVGYHFFLVLPKLDGCQLVCQTLVVASWFGFVVSVSDHAFFMVFFLQIGTIAPVCFLRVFLRFDTVAPIHMVFLWFPMTYKKLKPKQSLLHCYE